MPDRPVPLALLVVATALAASATAPATTATAAATAATASPAPVTAPVASAGPSALAGSGPPAGEATLLAVYPNPAAPGDAGEFAVLAVPPGTDLARLSLADDETTVSLPDRTAGGRVVLSTAPNATRPLADAPVLPLDPALAMANGGERLRLRRGNDTLAALAYRDAPEGELRTAGGWRPLGATDRPVVTGRNVEVRVFALPDAPGAPVAALRGAERRLLLAGYTFASERVAGVLVRAARRGVRVHVLVEGSPVGGVSRREARLLDRLAAAGVRVTVVGGPRARYDFHHAKYAVVDDRVLVLTENWKPAGTGGASSRGWGAVARDARLADALAGTFRRDAGWADGLPWTSFRRNRSFATDRPANGSYPSRFAPRRVAADRVTLLVAPDNARSGLVRLLRGAEESLLVEQATLEPESIPYCETVAAARRGVRVRVLLSGAWYARAENRRTVDRLNALARREDLPLRARLAEPRSRYGKVHAKGAVVDRRRVLVGSLNWNGHALTANREVDLVVADPAAGRYYAQLFRADWRGGVWRLPAGLAGAAALAVVLAGLVARRTVQFAADAERPDVDGVRGGRAP